MAVVILRAMWRQFPEVGFVSVLVIRKPLVSNDRRTRVAHNRNTGVCCGFHQMPILIGQGDAAGQRACISARIVVIEPAARCAIRVDSGHAVQRVVAVAQQVAVRVFN